MKEITVTADGEPHLLPRGDPSSDPGVLGGGRGADTGRNASAANGSVERVHRDRSRQHGKSAHA